MGSHEYQISKLISPANVDSPGDQNKKELTIDYYCFPVYKNKMSDHTPDQLTQKPWKQDPGTHIFKPSRHCQYIAKVKSYYFRIIGLTFGRFGVASESNGTSRWKNRMLEGLNSWILVSWSPTLPGRLLEGKHQERGKRSWKTMPVPVINRVIILTVSAESGLSNNKQVLIVNVR